MIYENNKAARSLAVGGERVDVIADVSRLALDGADFL